MKSSMKPMLAESVFTPWPTLIRFCLAVVTYRLSQDAPGIASSWP